MSDMTTIQISHINRDALLKVADIMQREHPELWSRAPSFNAAVGYLIGQTDLRVAYDPDPAPETA